jgi:HlyD family secretion protein
MTRRRLVIPIVLLVVVLAAVAVLRRGPRPTPVDVDTVRTRDVLQSIVTASGEIVAVRYADIGSTVMGRIVELPVAEGDRVRAGQLLARLDAVPAQSDADAAAAGTSAIEADRAAAAAQQTAARADLARARARSVEAMTALARAEALSQQGLSPAADLDAARAAADAAAADVAAAEAAVTRAEQAFAAARAAWRKRGRSRHAPRTCSRRPRSARPSTAWSRGCRCGRARWWSSASRTSRAPPS